MAIAATDEEKIFPSRPARLKFCPHHCCQKDLRGSPLICLSSPTSALSPGCRWPFCEAWSMCENYIFLKGLYRHELSLQRQLGVPSPPCVVGKTSNFLSFHMLFLNFSPNTNSKLSFKLIKACETTAIMFKLNHKLVKQDFQS